MFGKSELTELFCSLPELITGKWSSVQWSFKDPNITRGGYLLLVFAQCPKPVTVEWMTDNMLQHKYKTNCVTCISSGIGLPLV